VSLLKNGAIIGRSVSKKIEIRLIFGVIIQFSEFRARWHSEIKDSSRAGKFLSKVSKCRFCQNCRLSSYNTLQAKYFFG
jgi:hypothetical protein